MTAPLDNRQKAAREILREKKLLKTHLTLLTYNHLLNGIVKFRTRDVDNKDFKIKEDDLKLAIPVLNGIMTRKVAKRMRPRVVQFYESPNNKVKVPEFTFENSFCNKYLQLFVGTTGGLKEIERVCKEYVPNRAGVSRFLIIRLINRLKNSDNWSFVKRLTEDGICAQMLTDVRVSSDLRLLLKGINYSVIECACLLAKIGEDKKAIDLLRLLVEEEDVKENEVPKVVQEGQLKIGLVQELFDHALRQKNTDFAAFIFEIMSRDLPRTQLKLRAQRMTEMSAEQETNEDFGGTCASSTRITTKD